MKLNQDKCDLIVSGHKYENVFASVDQSIIWENKNQKLFGIIMNRKLNFNDYITSIWKKGSEKNICVS